jgi:cytochrome P450 family 150 subfamily A5
MNLAGANRDPRHFEWPDQFDITRKNVRDHLAFGRGPHACPGAPLARLEAKVGIERLFDHFEDITLDEERHGTGGDPRYSYLRSFILRGLNELHLRLR